jgi:hypothetical protein
MVLVVSIDSPKINHVKTGKTINPVHDPINLADQTESIDSETIFQAYQKLKLVGIPRKIAATMGLFSHQPENFCKFK